MGIGADCPPVSSYSGDWNRGVREGRGTCRFVAETTSSTPGTGSFSTGQREYGFPAALAPLVKPECSGLRGLDGTKCPPVAVPSTYDGEWMGGRPQGKGKLSLCSTEEPVTTVPEDINKPRSHGKETVIEGFWDGDQGLVHGRETLPRKGGMYEGQFHLGKRQGQGRLELPDGSEYEGEPSTACTLACKLPEAWGLQYSSWANSSMVEYGDIPTLLHSTAPIRPQVVRFS